VLPIRLVLPIRDGDYCAGLAFERPLAIDERHALAYT
jgi:hypothetical protein